MARVSSAQRRRELTAAAIEILIEHGPSALTTRRIAERTGVPVGTVHYAFRDKEELIAAVSEQVLELFAGALRKRIRPELGVRQALVDGLTGTYEWLRENPGLALAATEVLVAVLRTPSASAALADTGSFVRDILQQAATNDPNPPKTPIDELARFLTITADGLTLMFLTSGEGRVPEADLEHLVTAIQALP